MQYQVQQMKLREAVSFQDVYIWQFGPFCICVLMTIIRLFIFYIFLLYFLHIFAVSRRYQEIINSITVCLSFFRIMFKFSEVENNEINYCGEVTRLQKHIYIFLCILFCTIKN